MQGAVAGDGDQRRARLEEERALWGDSLPEARRPALTRPSGRAPRAASQRSLTGRLPAHLPQPNAPPRPLPQAHTTP